MWIEAMKKIILLVLLTVVAMPALAGKVYQWRDADGRVFYSDQPPPVSGVKERQIRPNTIGNKVASAASQVKEAATVILWVSANCEPMCSDAIALLDQRNVPYDVRNVDPSNDKSMLAFFTAAGSMQARPPILLIGNEVFKEWNSPLWQSALTKAGYPLKSNK
jgi:hypothetical protein